MDETSRLTIEGAIAEHFLALGVASPGSAETDLRDAGLNSLQIVDLILLLEEKCSVEIPLNEVTPENFRSVGTIVRLLQRLDVRGGERLSVGAGR